MKMLKALNHVGEVIYQETCVWLTVLLFSMAVIIFASIHFYDASCVTYLFLICVDIQGATP